MANSNVFTGADGSVTLSHSATLEGKAAGTVMDSYNLSSVGRVQNVRVEVTSEVRAFHEIGQRYATELRSGNVAVKGTIGRAYINGALVKLLLGDAAAQRPTGAWVQPTFDITLLAQSPAAPNTTNTITLHDVKLDSWVYNLPEDDFVLEAVTFQALYLTVEDKATG
jgi:hypothetical protein